MGVQHGRFYAVERDKFRLTAACDTNVRRLETAKATYQCAVYSDAQAFLADPNMELVVISTLSLDHTRHAVAALEAGKYVLLDKPIAITDAELATLRRADEAHPGKLSVLHNLRFEPGFEAVQKIVAQGLLGDVNLVKLRRHLQGHYVRSDWQTLLDYGGGLLNNRVADLEISYNVMLPEPYCTVYGSRGSLACNAAMDEIQLKYIDLAYDIPQLNVEIDATAYSSRLTQEIPWLEETIKVESHGNMCEYIDRKLITCLYDSIRNGIPTPIRNSDAFETIRIIQDVKKQNPQFNWIQ